MTNPAPDPQTPAAAWERTEALDDLRRALAECAVTGAGVVFRCRACDTVHTPAELPDLAEFVPQPPAGLSTDQERFVIALQRVRQIFGAHLTSERTVEIARMILAGASAAAAPQPIASDLLTAEGAAGGDPCEMVPVEHPAYVIVRSESAGVAAGTLTDRSRDGSRAVLTGARRIWYWAGAASLSELATLGTSRPDDCKFPAPVDVVELLGVIEVLAVTPQARTSIERVPVWSAH